MTTSESALPSSSTPSRRVAGKPHYANSDAEGFVGASRITKARLINPEVVRNGPALLAVDREVEQEEDEQSSVEPATVKVMTAQHTAKTPSLNQPVRGNSKGSRKKNSPPAAFGRKRDDDIPPPLPGPPAPSAGRVLQTTPRQRRAIAQELFAAVRNRDETSALALLAGPGGEQVAGYLGDEDMSLVHEAVSMRMPSVLWALLAYPEGRKRAAHPDKYGATPLYLAAANGDVAILEILLAVDDVVRDAYRRTMTGDDAISVAIDKDKAEILARLLQIDAVHEQLPYRQSGEGKTMLEVAVSSGSVDALRVLLPHPDLTRQAALPARFGLLRMDRNNDTMSLARQAANSGDLPTLTALTELASVRQFEAASNGAFNLAGMALHSGNMALFQHLYQFPELHRLAGLRTISGCTPLMLAVRTDDAGLFARLLQIAEVRATILSSPGKKYPMQVMWPVNLGQEAFEYSDVVELAIMKGKSAMVSTLLQMPEVIRAVTARGEYAQKLLLLLIAHGMPEALDALLQLPIVAKIALIADKEGMTALHHAAQQGERRAVAMLIRKLPMTEVARANRLGRTAIDLAKQAGQDEVADFLASVARVRQAMGVQ